MTEEEIRLDQTKKVFEALADFVINGSGSYRYLIYDKLGFECKDYADLIAGLTITNAIVELEDLREENQKLKQQLDKYENPEDMTLMMMWCTEKVKDENRALNKQVEDYKKLGFKYLQDKNNNLENQQKEFIKYMNSCIKELEKESPNKLQNTINLAIKDIAKIILQKYKEIIGVSDEKEN